jgi:hypothetical protein
MSDPVVGDVPRAAIVCDLTGIVKDSEAISIVLLIMDWSLS